MNLKNCTLIKLNLNHFLFLILTTLLGGCGHSGDNLLEIHHEDSAGINAANAPLVFPAAGYLIESHSAISQQYPELTDKSVNAIYPQAPSTEAGRTDDLYRSLKGNELKSIITLKIPKDQQMTNLQRCEADAKDSNKITCKKLPIALLPTHQGQALQMTDSVDLPKNSTQPKTVTYRFNLNGALRVAQVKAIRSLVIRGIFVIDSANGPLNDSGSGQQELQELILTPGSRLYTNGTEFRIKIHHLIAGQNSKIQSFVDLQEVDSREQASMLTIASFLQAEKDAIGKAAEPVVLDVGHLDGELIISNFGQQGGAHSIENAIVSSACTETSARLILTYSPTIMENGTLNFNQWLNGGENLVTFTSNPNDPEPKVGPLVSGEKYYLFTAVPRMRHCPNGAPGQPGLSGGNAGAISVRIAELGSSGHLNFSALGGNGGEPGKGAGGVLTKDDDRAYMERANTFLSRSDVAKSMGLCIDAHGSNDSDEPCAIRNQEPLPIFYNGLHLVDGANCPSFAGSDGVTWANAEQSRPVHRGAKIFADGQNRGFCVKIDYNDAQMNSGGEPGPDSTVKGQSGEPALINIDIPDLIASTDKGSFKY